MDIDPLVFQSKRLYIDALFIEFISEAFFAHAFRFFPCHAAYKTFMCFVTSWLVLAIGEPLSFTPWGIVSACFWVPGGVAAIAGIKMAGLAVAMGTLSSFIVLVSFVWGIFVFDERIHSREMACLAIFLMMMGLCGMSYYSSLEHEDDQQSTYDRIRVIEDEEDDYRLLDDDDVDEEEAMSPSQSRDSHEGNHEHVQNENTDGGDETMQEPLVNQAESENENLPPNAEVSTSPTMNSLNNDVVIICGRAWPRRKVGIACSIFCGIWGGSIMAPEKLAKADTSGLGYLISFAIGAVIVTTALWMFRFSYHWARLGSAAGAYQALPSFHIRVMWLPGCTAGALWSIGNFFSLISVKYLGEGKRMDPVATLCVPDMSSLIIHPSIHPIDERCRI